MLTFEQLEQYFLKNKIIASKAQIQNLLTLIYGEFCPPTQAVVSSEEIEYLQTLMQDSELVE